MLERDYGMHSGEGMGSRIGSHHRDFGSNPVADTHSTPAATGIGSFPAHRPQFGATKDLHGSGPYGALPKRPASTGVLDSYHRPVGSTAVALPSQIGSNRPVGGDFLSHPKVVSSHAVKDWQPGRDADQLRAVCLALRDLREMTDALGARLVWDDGTELHADEVNIVLISDEGLSLDLTHWADWTGALPA